MPSKPTRRAAEAPIASPPHTLPAAEIKSVVAIQCLKAQTVCSLHYVRALKKYALPLEDKIVEEQKLELLKTVEALAIFLAVYAHSPNVSNEVRSAVSAAPSTGGRPRPITRNSLAETLVEELRCTETFDALRQRATRIVDAAILLGFLKVGGDARENCKPLLATERLDRMLVTAGSKSAKLIYKAIGNRA